MAKISPKDNFMRLVNGGTPEYVPFYTMMGEPYLGEAGDVTMFPSWFEDTSFQPGGKDKWGVTYAMSEGGVQATMPDTRIIMLEDIYDWSKVIKFPEPLDVDPERMYNEQLKQMNIDRSQSCVKVNPGFSPFGDLTALMGFQGGLTALYTDPEEVSAMLNAMCDYLMPFVEKTIDVYKPDMWFMGDDTAAKETPFFSPQIFHDVFKPIYERLAKPARDRGIPIIFHNCGKMEEFIPDMYDFGVTIFEPLQLTNDLMAFKKNYKGKASFIGGWDWDVHMPKTYPIYDEEEVRQDIRDTIDKYSVDGGYAFIGWPISYAGDPNIEALRLIVRDEAHWYGRKVYGYTGDDE